MVPVLLWILAGGAQDAAPAFEVASVRLNTSGEQARSFRMEPPGTLRATNVTVRHLMWNAYGVQDFQIVGGPGWIGSERYDVVARAGGKPSQEQLRAMLRAFLEERFKLRATPTTREMPIYALLVSPESASKLRPAESACAATTGGPAPGCGAIVGNGTLRARGLSMTRLAGELTGWIGRRVADRTGLSGNFQIELEWAPGLSADAPAADTRPSIFTAVREQLGLRLEPAVGPVDVVVVESIERPVPD
jgi:uncharacterized protein (TIGR03435 family)